MAKLNTNEKLDLVPVKNEAEKWNTEPKNIINWIKTGKISGSRIGETWAVEKGSITEYMRLNAKISHYNEILEEKLKEKKEAIEKFNNDIFIVKNLYELTPAFQMVLYEMSTLIPDPERQVIFLDMFLGEKDIDNIAESHHTTIEKIISIQKANIKIIIGKTNFLKDYLNTLESLKLAIKKLEIENATKTDIIQRLRKLLPPETQEEIAPEIERTLTPEVIKILSTPLKDVIKDKRSFHCLLSLDLHTVEDLIRFLKVTDGYNSFLRVRNFGKKTLQKLRVELYQKKLVDINGKSYLFKYI